MAGGVSLAAGTGEAGLRDEANCSSVQAGGGKPKSARARRFYGSVEIDGNGRPVKAFETILSSVVMELLRSLARR